MMDDPETVNRILSVDPRLWPKLPPPAMLIIADARRAYGDARRGFEAVTIGRFADDAAYGAAWSRHVAGDDQGAESALQMLARGARRRTRRMSRRLVRLEPSAVLRAGLQGYCELHVGTDDAWLAEMLDGDGAQLARAALRLIGRPALVSPAPAAPARAALPGRTAPDVTSPSAVTHGADPTAPRLAAESSGAGRFVVLALVVVIAAMVIAVRRGTRAVRP